MTIEDNNKFCGWCKTNKEKSLFGKSKSSKDGLMSCCRACMSAYDKARDKTKQRKINHNSAKSRQQEYRKSKYLNDEYRKKCNERCKQYYVKNKEKIIKYKVQQSKKDSKSILVTSIKARIRGIFKKSPYTKKSRVFEILGCSYDFFHWHIEKQFTNGMNWDVFNKIHIDHIIPISSAKTEEDVIKLNHYTNLRPLWAADNLRKSNKLETLL